MNRVNMVKMSLNIYTTMQSSELMTKAHQLNGKLTHDQRVPNKSQIPVSHHHSKTKNTKNLVQLFIHKQARDKRPQRPNLHHFFSSCSDLPGVAHVTHVKS